MHMQLTTSSLRIRLAQTGDVDVCYRAAGELVGRSDNVRSRRLHPLEMSMLKLHRLVAVGLAQALAN